MNCKNVKTYLGDLEERLIKAHENGQEKRAKKFEFDVGENIKIDGYNVNYANFRHACLVLTKQEKHPSTAPQFALFGFSKTMNHSVQVALEAFRWLIQPFDVQIFFR